MATTQFAFMQVESRSVPCGVVDDSVCESKTPTASSSPTTAVATAAQSVCRVATDTQVMVSFGTAPNATSDSIKFLIPAGAVEYFVVQSGWKADAVTA